MAGAAKVAPTLGGPQPNHSITECGTYEVAAHSAHLHPHSSASLLWLPLLPRAGDEAVPLAAGEELLIAYAGSFTPLEAFLKFGFVAPEWWPAGGSSSSSSSGGS